MYNLPSNIFPLVLESPPFFVTSFRQGIRSVTFELRGLAVGTDVHVTPVWGPEGYATDMIIEETLV